MIRSIWQIARREYIGYVTAWGFWFGLLLTPLGLAIGGLLPGFIEQSQPVRYYTVVDGRDDVREAVDWQLESWRAGAALGALQQSLTTATPEDQRIAIEAFEQSRADGGSPEDALKAAKAGPEVIAPERKFVSIRAPSSRLGELERLIQTEMLLSGPSGDRPLFAALIVHRDQLGNIKSVDHLSKDVVTSDLRHATEGAMRRISRLQLLDGAGISEETFRQVEATAPTVFNRKVGQSSSPTREVSLADQAPFIAAAVIALFLWFLIFSVVNFLLTGTIEERANKIFDSLLTSVRLSDLLAGKLLGVFLLSATLMGSWAVIALWASLQLGDNLSPFIVEFLGAALKPQIILPALVGFVAGYLMYGAIFLAFGSLCDTIQEAQTLVTPLVMLLMTPLLMIVVSISNPSSELVHAFSWVPIMTPFLMILRAPLEPPLWETLAHLALMVAATWLALHISARVFRAGAVHGAGLVEVRSWFARLSPFGKSSKSTD